MSQLTAKVRSIRVKGVPFTQTPHPESAFIFGEGVKFQIKDEGQFTPVFETMVLNADWFRQIPWNAQGILSPHRGMVFVNRIGDLEEWKISSFGPRLSVQIVEGDYLEISGSFEEISEIFGQVTFDD
jgi:hypothetical protein